MPLETRRDQPTLSRKTNYCNPRHSSWIFSSDQLPDGYPPGCSPSISTQLTRLCQYAQQKVATNANDLPSRISNNILNLTNLKPPTTIQGTCVDEPQPRKFASMVDAIRASDNPLGTPVVHHLPELPVVRSTKHQQQQSILEPQNIIKFQA